jgi:hypothetical protein
MNVTAIAVAPTNLPAYQRLPNSILNIEHATHPRGLFGLTKKFTEAVYRLLRLGIFESVQRLVRLINCRVDLRARNSTRPNQFDRGQRFGLS